MTQTHIDTVLYHRGCRDGGTAAWCLRRFGGLHSAAYHSVTYYEDPPWELIDDKHVLIVDFSYKRQVLLDVLHRAASLTVLDHHKSAAEDLQGLDFCTFDMNKSGAMLAWDWCREHRRDAMSLRDRAYMALAVLQPEEELESINAYLLEEECVFVGHMSQDQKRLLQTLGPYTTSYYAPRGQDWLVLEVEHLVEGVPWPIAYAQDYDLWQHRLPHTHEIAAIYEFETVDDFDRLDQLFESGFASCSKEGKTLYRTLVWESKDIIQKMATFEKSGVSVGMCNCSARHWSRALNMYLRQNPTVDFGVAFTWSGDRWTYTLRSVEGSSVDVSTLARVFGGGGHKHAAGFSIPSFPIHGEALIDAYLSVR